MAATTDPAPATEPSSVAAWRTVLLLLLILIISSLWEYGNRIVEHWLEKHGRGGLAKAWQQLKSEILTLGIISLLLIVFQSYLVKICINSKDSGSADAAYPPAARRLLAGTTYTCPAGKESMWPAELIHRIHILIFLIGLNHVFYACLSVFICNLSVRKWERWEQEFVQQEAEAKKHLSLPALHMKRKGEQNWYYKLRASTHQFTQRMDKPTYLALRRMRLEQLGEDYQVYDFTKHVVYAMEVEYAQVFNTEWIGWLITILFVIVPRQTFLDLWLSILLLALSIVIGGKLHIIVSKLAQNAYTLYKDQLTPHQKRQNRTWLSQAWALLPGSTSLGTSLMVGGRPKRLWSGATSQSQTASEPPLLARRSAPAVLNFDAKAAWKKGIHAQLAASKISKLGARSLRSSVAAAGSEVDGVTVATGAAPAFAAVRPRALSSVTEAAIAGDEHAHDGAEHGHDRLAHESAPPALSSSSGVGAPRPPLEVVVDENRPAGGALLVGGTGEDSRAGARGEPVAEGRGTAAQGTDPWWPSADESPRGIGAAASWRLHGGGPVAEADERAPADRSANLAKSHSFGAPSRSASGGAPALATPSPGPDGRGDHAPHCVDFAVARDVLEPPPPARRSLEAARLPHGHAGFAGATAAAVVRAAQHVVPHADANGKGPPPPAAAKQELDRLSFEGVDTSATDAPPAEPRRSAPWPFGCLSYLHRRAQRRRRLVRGETGVFEERRITDYKKLFWFGRPGLMLQVFRLTYFKNALTLAVIYYSFWQNDHKLFKGAVVTEGMLAIITIVLLGVDLLLLIHGAIYVLPIFILAKTLIEHLPENLKKSAALPEDMSEDAIGGTQAAPNGKQDKGHAVQPQHSAVVH